MISIVGRLEFHVDQVHCGIGAGDVDELKDLKKKKDAVSSTCYNCSSSPGSLHQPQIHIKLKYSKIHFWVYTVPYVIKPPP